KGTNAQRTVVLAPGQRGFGRWLGRGPRNLRLVFGYVFQECRGGREKQVSSDGPTEIEQSVVIAGRAANEHVLQHLLNRTGRTAVANEIGAKFTLRGPPEGHVVAQDLGLFPILDDGSECVMR